MTSTPLKTSNISVIIPTLNEEGQISRLGSMLQPLGGEIILVDGGSTDHTVKAAEDIGFTVLRSPLGRASQMNKGAHHARGTILLFLHADTVLPVDFTEPILEAFEDAKTALTAFSLSVNTKSVLLRAIIGIANIRSRWFHLPYGDQAIALRATTFFGLGGFPDLPIMEDYQLVKRASGVGSIITFQQKVTTSARRWKRLGILQTTLINQIVVVGFKLGVAPERLALLYRRGLIRLS
ncbi:MAG: glycosyltransferase family 2 protein [Desulfobacterales bacterium]|nr:TIGR04283 family arsenosugar biosynthesis glycosyltransferase [Deltaproteobacteria bacterium]NNK94309.1 glycosyltransferase family 2 protein [Desulfobacterales bacterium]